MNSLSLRDRQPQTAQTNASRLEVFRVNEFRLDVSDSHPRTTKQDRIYLEDDTIDESMPLPASLFLQRGRSDSMMSTVEDEPQQQHSLRGDDATVIDQSASQTSSSSSNMLQAGIELDASGAPMYTPPITMTAFDNQYGPHGLLASAMSSSYGSSPFSGSSGYNNASSMSSYPFNPRANLLRRTSSSSTLDSSEDEDEVAWSAYDVERLTAVSSAT